MSERFITVWQKGARTGATQVHFASQIYSFERPPTPRYNGRRPASNDQRPMSTLRPRLHRPPLRPMSLLRLPCVRRAVSSTTTFTTSSTAAASDASTAAHRRHHHRPHPILLRPSRRRLHHRQPDPPPPNPPPHPPPPPAQCALRRPRLEPANVLSLVQRPLRNRIASGANA